MLAVRAKEPELEIHVLPVQPERLQRKLRVIQSRLDGRHVPDEVVIIHIRHELHPVVGVHGGRYLSDEPDARTPPLSVWLRLLAARRGEGHRPHPALYAGPNGLCFNVGRVPDRSCPFNREPRTSDELLQTCQLNFRLMNHKQAWDLNDLAL